MASHSQVQFPSLNTYLAKFGLLKEFSFEELNFNQNNKIGEGGGGKVYKTKIFGQDKAIKVIIGNNIKNSISQLVKYAKLNHDNILLFQGFCYSQSILYLVFPYKEKGSLDKCIHEINSITDDEKKDKIKLQILIDIAKGLEYLHQNQIIHQDLKPANILLDDNYNARICDFESSNDFQDSKSIITYTEG